MTTEKLDALTAKWVRLTQERNSIYQTVTDKLVEVWKAADGCEECLGWERVVTWSTLDGAGWTEYGPCSKCTPDSKAAGKKPGSFWAGGYNAAVSGMVFDAPDKEALLNTYEGHLEALQAAIKAERYRHVVGPGKTVAVVRGRKVPKGTTGRCFWLGQDHYGKNRIGLDANGVTYWTAASNVEVAEAA